MNIKNKRNIVVLLLLLLLLWTIVWPATYSLQVILRATAFSRLKIFREKKEKKRKKRLINYEKERNKILYARNWWII